MLIPFLIMVLSNRSLREWTRFHCSINIINLIMMVFIMYLGPDGFIVFSIFSVVISFVNDIFSHNVYFYGSKSRGSFIWIGLFSSVLVDGISGFINLIKMVVISKKLRNISDGNSWLDIAFFW